MSSIAQYDPRLVLMILDTCRTLSADDSAPDGGKRKHVLKIPKTQITKALEDHVVAHACGPSDTASDSGECTIDKRRTASVVV